MCPKCQELMRPYERNGVTVDQCTGCRGLFLDRGELERLVNAEHTWHAAAAPRRHSGEYPGYRAHKRRSFLSDLFD